MFDTAAVTTRPWACWVALIFAALSMSDMIQPPKMSPSGLVFAGIASVREASSPRGSIEPSFRFVCMNPPKEIAAARTLPPR